MPAAKATVLSRLLPHLKKLKKVVGKLLGEGWDVAFADVVPQGPVVRQWCCPSCQSHCERQGKDVCLGQVAVLLQREGKAVRKEHIAILSKGELGYEVKKKQAKKKKSSKRKVCIWHRLHHASELFSPLQRKKIGSRQ